MRHSERREKMQKDRPSASPGDRTEGETDRRRLERKGRRKGSTERLRGYREGEWSRRRRKREEK